MFKSVILPIKFDCFVGWVVGVGVLTLGRGVLRPGNSWWGCAAGSLNPDPISDQKIKFFTPVFRPVPQGFMSSILRLERQQKHFLNFASNLHISLSFLFIIRSYTSLVSSKTIPDSRPKWAKSIPVWDRNDAKTILFVAAPTVLAYTRDPHRGS